MIPCLKMNPSPVHCLSWPRIGPPFQQVTLRAYMGGRQRIHRHGYIDLYRSIYRTPFT